MRELSRDGRTGWTSLAAGIASASLILAVGGGSVARAQTADGETPAEETVCDEEMGALKGLCNAYCEAMDCHLDEGIHASPEACGRVLENYHKKSGNIDPPCLEAGCAETAAREADAAFYECLESPKCDERTCIKIAQSTFNIAFAACQKQCLPECKQEYDECLVLAGGDKEAARLCKIRLTECTDACMEEPGKYVPPKDMCQDPPQKCIPSGDVCDPKIPCCTNGATCETREFICK